MQFGAYFIGLHLLAITRPEITSDFGKYNFRVAPNMIDLMLPHPTMS